MFRHESEPGELPNQVPAERGDFGCIVTMGGVVTPALDEAEQIRRVYERESSNYDRNVKLPERLLFSGGREWVCARAEGEVLEIAMGTGLNLPHYPDGVRLTGIEFVPTMLDIARRRAVELGRPVELRLGDAQALEFEDATFDTVVCTLSLCTIPDDRAAVAEVRRVLRPGGRFVLLEHVRSPVRAVRGVQRLLAPAFVRFGADHVLREPLEQVQAEGFSIELLERSKLGLVERLLARKPAQAERETAQAAAERLMLRHGAEPWCAPGGRKQVSTITGRLPSSSPRACLVCYAAIGKGVIANSSGVGGVGLPLRRNGNRLEDVRSSEPTHGAMRRTAQVVRSASAVRVSLARLRPIGFQSAPARRPLAGR